MLDELERVRAYRADVPQPDAATVRAARLELMRAISEEARPAVPADRARRRWSRPRPSAARLHALQRRRRFVLAGGLATIGIGVAGMLGFDTAATPTNALAAQMNQLAKVAASQDWTGIPGPGQYLYTESNGLTESDMMASSKECVVWQVEHRQIWIATDGSGAISDTRNQSRFTSAADQATCAALGVTDAGSQDSSWSNRFAAGGLSFPTNDWKSLSTDPATLLKQVHERDGGPGTPAEWFTNVADFMRESDVPPEIRSALYQAVALIPGVRLLGTQTDPTGQSGLGVAYYPGGEPTHELIFDQQTGRLLAEEYFDASGKMTDWTSYTAQKIVDSVPDYPMEPDHAAEEAKPSSSASQTPPAGVSGAATAPPTTTTGS
jgi:RNA polymerase sigma-70 factor (ECF subfamily)